jgi:4-hydroxybenzoate polyprenyltransferase
MKKFLDLPDDFKNTTVILDVDGTLTPDKGENFGPEVANKVNGLSKNCKVYLCSNGNPERNEKFADLFGVELLYSRKPFGALALKKSNVAKSDIVVVGDKYLTDGIFARILGAKFIKVEHMRSQSDSLHTKTFYFFDDAAWNIRSYFKLMRPFQWLKNLLVIAPIFFAGAVFNAGLLSETVLSAFIFCLVSSAMYIVNDLFDIKQDRLHPIKKNRPLASGDVSERGAIVLLSVLSVLSVALLLVETSIVPIIIVYVVLNLLYSFKLKHVAVLDLICVASFYILRILAGGLSTGTYISPWIILCVFFGSLFVVVGKRYGESFLENRRQVLGNYSREILNFMLIVSSTLVIISYGIYSIIGHDYPYLVYSTVFVVFVIFRMLNYIYTHPKEAESPELAVFKDTWILAAFVSWLLFVFWIFY